MGTWLTSLLHSAREPTREDMLVSQPPGNAVRDRPRGFGLKPLVSKQPLLIFVGYEGQLDKGGRHFRVAQDIEPSVLDPSVHKPGCADKGHVYGRCELPAWVARPVVVRLRATGAIATSGVAVNGHERCDFSVVGSHHARSEGHRGVFRPRENDTDSPVPEQCCDPRCHGEIDVGLARPGSPNRSRIIPTVLVARVEAHSRRSPEHPASPPKLVLR